MLVQLTLIWVLIELGLFDNGGCDPLILKLAIKVSFHWRFILHSQVVHKWLAEKFCTP